MKYLVDTHILLWFFTNPDNLSEKVREILLSEENLILSSQFSLWEISIKYNLGKLIIKNLTPEKFYLEIEDSFFNCLPISNKELISFYKLLIEQAYINIFKFNYKFFRYFSI